LKLNGALRELTELFGLFNYNIWGEPWGGFMKRELGVMYIYVLWLGMCTLEMYMLILMFWYIRMNVITHGFDCKALIYEHECDYPLGWNEILEAEYTWISVRKL